MKDIRCSLKVLLLEPSLKLKGFSSRDTRDMGLILGSGRSPRVGNGNLLQYSSLENFMDRGAWRNIVHWVTKSQKHNWVTKHIACSILYLQLYLTSNFSNSLSFCGFFFFSSYEKLCVCVSVSGCVYTFLWDISSHISTEILFFKESPQHVYFLIRGSASS